MTKQPVDYTHRHPLNSRTADHLAAAEYYGSMFHRPTLYPVEVSYVHFKHQTIRQFLNAQYGPSPIEIDFHTGSHNYASSAEMFEDLSHGHLWTLLTDPPVAQMPEDHPMLEATDFNYVTEYGGPLLLNDIFRAVHDIYGHGVSGGSFGPEGEYSAWLAHRNEYDQNALPALWCETRGQSAWTNYFGDHASKPLRERPFAAQKSGYVVEWLV